MGETMTAEERLIEWGKELHYPGWDIPSPTGGIIGRLIDDGRDERLKRRRRQNKLLALERRIYKRGKPIGREVPCKETRGVRMEIVVVDGDSVACPPDGGLGKMVERMASSIERSQRCRALSVQIDLMPMDLRTFIDATYRLCAAPREVPRPWDEAARMMGVSKSAYFRRKERVLEWVTERLGLWSPLAA